MAKKRVSKKSKRRLMTLGILSVIAIGYFCVTLVGYIYSYMSLKKEEANLKNDLVNLQEEKANLKIEIQKLNDPDYVARYAKEKYLYSSDGEYVLKMDDNNKKEEEKAVSSNTTLYIIIGGAVIFVGVVIIFKKKNNSKH